MRFRRRSGLKEDPGTAAAPARTGSTQDCRPEICVDHVSKSFDGRHVLHDINIEIHTGELVVIVGESGCGKTVLLDIVTGMIDPDAGRILVADHDQAGAPLLDFSAMREDQRARIRRHWGEVFQRNALFGGTVRDNIALWFRENTVLPECEIEERIRRSLTAVNLDGDKVIDQPKRSLSGGMAKRVAIARAIAIEPTVMFYDEPTSGLDPATSSRIHDLIWKMHHEKRGDGAIRTTVIVSHDRDLLRRLAPRVLMLHEARVHFDGCFDEFESLRDPILRRYLDTMPRLHSGTLCRAGA